MSKLLKLKKWLTLDEAVIHISNVLGESFTLANMYEFALDRDLVLSVNFVNTVKAKKVTFIKKEDIKYKKGLLKNPPNMPADMYFNIPINAQYPISKDLWVGNIEEQVVSLSGVWDLSMMGAEKFSIEKLHQQEISSGIEVKVPEALSVYVKKAEDTYQLQLFLTREQYRERHNNPTGKELKPRILDCALAYPASRLDELDHVLVVKVKEITRFIQWLEDKPQEDKPLHTKERNKLNDMIEALLLELGVNPSNKGTAAVMKLIAEKHEKTMSENTARKILRQITDITDITD